MERKIEKFFLKWKTDVIRKPLLLFGLKQIGKTYTVLEFGRKHYQYVAYFNTSCNQALLDLFKKERSIDKLAVAFSAMIDVPVLKNETLLVFDNVDDEELMKGIKLFGFDRNDYHVIAITSRRENLTRFKGEELQYKIMTEMDFEEYLWARGEKEIADNIRYAYQEGKRCAYHAKALDLFYDYLLTGGFPEVVLASLQYQEPFEMESAKEKVFDILKSFLNECNPLIDIPRGLEVLNSIPKQLQKENKKFQYGVLGYGKRAKEYESVIQYLVSNLLVNRSYKITTVKSPLSSCRELDSFKLYYPDDGLLSGRLHITKKQLLEDDELKYTLYENHIAHTLLEAGYSLYYYQSEGKAEVNFVIQNRMGKIIPIEIATKKGSKVKSLSVFMKRYMVLDAYRITENNFSEKKEVHYLPVYAVFCLNEQLY